MQKLRRSIVVALQRCNGDRLAVAGRFMELAAAMPLADVKAAVNHLENKALLNPKCRDLVYYKKTTKSMR